MGIININMTPIFNRPENTDFVKEFEDIRKEFSKSFLTEHSKYQVLKRWEIFINNLIDGNLIDKEVGKSLIKFFDLTITLS